MKFFAALIAIVLAAAVVWVVFFSGLILNKQVNDSLTSNEIASPGSAVHNLNSVAVLETNLGTIKIALDNVSAPKTAENFEKLARKGFYDGLIFHRVIPGFVIQGGDPKGDGTGGPGHTVPAEIKLPHKRGAVAMARTPDAVNPERRSSGSQFYIALKDLPGLDGEYTVFGQVAEGMDVVDKIAKVKTNALDKPLEPVIIKKATIKRLE